MRGGGGGGEGDKAEDDAVTLAPNIYQLEYHREHYCEKKSRK